MEANEKEGGPAVRVVDCTPVGLQTAEGVARVNAATDRFSQEAFRAAALLLSLYDNGGIRGVQARKVAGEVCERYRSAHEELCRALAGAPKA